MLRCPLRVHCPAEGKAEMQVPASKGPKKCFRSSSVCVCECHWQKYSVQDGSTAGEWAPNPCFSLSHHRKKTSTWWSTVAGCLSVGSPLFFRSGAQEFGEPGWWKLVHNKPPTLKPEGEKLSTSALKAKGNSVPSSV